MARSKSSNAWLREHVNDHYVQMAQKDGYRARAAYKLLEINDKDKLIRPGTVLAEIAAALDGNPREKFVSVEAMLEAIGR